MLKSDIVDFFGSVPKAAEALGVTRSAAYQWKDIVPERMAYRAQAISRGKLKVHPSVYERRERGAA